MMPRPLGSLTAPLPACSNVNVLGQVEPYPNDDRVGLSIIKLQYECLSSEIPRFAALSGPVSPLGGGRMAIHPTGSPHCGIRNVWFELFSLYHLG